MKIRSNARMMVTRTAKCCQAAAEVSQCEGITDWPSLNMYVLYRFRPITRASRLGLTDNSKSEQRIRESE
jgi:hypothetical protein